MSGAQAGGHRALSSGLVGDKARTGTRLLHNNNGEADVEGGRGRDARDGGDSVCDESSGDDNDDNG